LLNKKHYICPLKFTPFINKRQTIMEKQLSCVDAFTHSPLRRWLIAIFIVMIMLPIVGKGQNSGTKSESINLVINSWIESSVQPGYYRRIGSQSHPADHAQDTIPTDVIFNLSTCNKFSIELTNANGGGMLYYNQVVYEFYNPNGTLAFQYTEPEPGPVWESNYGNTLTYTSGITPDYAFSTPGRYYLKIRSFNPGIESSSFRYYGIEVTSNTPSFTLNMPDSVCYQEYACWSLNSATPIDSFSLATNWGYINYNLNTFDLCDQAIVLGNNNITVYVSDVCGNDTTLTKNLYVKYMSDFTLPTSVCMNSTFNVGEIFYCYSPANPTSYLWNWGDGTTSNTHYASHSYLNAGTYTVRLTVGTPIGSNTISKTITVNPLPERPVFTYDVLNTCDNPGTFTITNPQTGTTYNWSTSFYLSMTGPDTVKTFVWDFAHFPTPPNYDTLHIIANNGCVDTTDFKIWRCCNKGILIVDTILTSMPTPHDNLDYYINGTVVINNNINIQSTNISFGPEAKIIVNPPYTFNVNLSRLKADCGYMWDGIYVNTPQSKVVISNSPQVSDAFNAINSINGGNFEVTGTTFTDNYIGIKVIGYHPIAPVANHQGLVYGSTFRNLTNMIAPYAGQKAYTGVYTDNVYNLTIGSSTLAYNTFDNVFCGIQSYNTNLTVAKNRFQNIKKVPMCTNNGNTDYIGLYCETGIHVAKKDEGPDSYIPTITMDGGSLANGNLFYDCDMAFNSYGTKHTIKYCTTDTTLNAFMIRDASISSFTNNKITGAKYGFYIVNTSPAIKNIIVDNNEININKMNCFGISFYNCKSHPTSSLVKVKVTNNVINYKMQYPTSAIIASNCDYITITGDSICNKYAATVFTNRKLMMGVVMSNSPNSLVKANTIIKLGTGIWAEGMETGTKFQCNTLTQNYYGFYMPNVTGSIATTYSNQGDSLHPNDNAWTDHPSPGGGYPAYRITGDVGSSIYPRKWYIRSGYPEKNPNIVSGTPAYYFALPYFLPNDYPSPCSGSKGGDDEYATTDSTSTMDEIIPDTTNLAPQMRYMYMAMLYNSNADLFADEIAQNEQGLYDNIPLIAKINELAQTDTTLDKAIALNNALAPANEMEKYRKFVNSVYLEYIAKSIAPSTELIDELYSIADISPSVGGEAVHIARAILNYEPILLSKKDVMMPIRTSLNDNIQFFPNPANDMLTVSSTDNFTLDSKIELYDITGRLVYSSFIGIETNTVTINLKEVKQGLYLCVIKNSKEIISSFKISVVKQ
jgi:hypothetical protein